MKNKLSLKQIDNRTDKLVAELNIEHYPVFLGRTAITNRHIFLVNKDRYSLTIARDYLNETNETFEAYIRTKEHLQYLTTGDRDWSYYIDSFVSGYLNFEKQYKRKKKLLTIKNNLNK